MYHFGTWNNPAIIIKKDKTMKKFIPYAQIKYMPWIIFCAGIAITRYYHYFPWYILLMILGMMLLVVDIPTLIEENLVNGMQSINLNQREVLEELKSLKLNLRQIRDKIKD